MNGLQARRVGEGCGDAGQHLGVTIDIVSMQDAHHLAADLGQALVQGKVDTLIRLTDQDRLLGLARRQHRQCAVRAKAVDNDLPVQ